MIYQIFLHFYNTIIILELTFGNDGFCFSKLIRLQLGITGESTVIGSFSSGSISAVAMPFFVSMTTSGTSLAFSSSMEIQLIKEAASSTYNDARFESGGSKLSQLFASEHHSSDEKDDTEDSTYFSSTGCWCFKHLQLKLQSNTMTSCESNYGALYLTKILQHS